MSWARKPVSLLNAAATLSIFPFRPRELPLVRGDYSTLHRLLWILVDNAVKYTTPPGNIQIVLRESGEMLVIEVRDTGIGISPSDLPHIFKRFYRGERSRSQIDGSGLGLAIARWIADTHQAELYCGKSGAWWHHVPDIDSGSATLQPTPTDDEQTFRSGRSRPAGCD